jgi:hypothetical protein
LIKYYIGSILARFAASRIFDEVETAKANLTKAISGELTGQLDLYKLETGYRPLLKS